MRFTRRKTDAPHVQHNDNQPFFKERVQAKLSVGQPGDQFEKEADSVADKVVSQTGSGDVQKKGQPEEEKVQQKPLAESISSVQLKELGDDEKVQQQADEKDEKTVQKKDEDKKDDPLQKKEEDKELAQKKEEDKKDDAIQKKEEDKEPVQKKEKEEPKDDAVQKKDDEKDQLQKKEEEKEPVQKKGNGSTAPPSTEAKLASSKGQGSAMSGALKQEMESGFGADLGNVRIHNDSKAEQMSQEMGAQAFTHGNDVYFNKGKFNPDTKAGKHLLAHELTHTIQQKGMVQKKVQRHMQKNYPWDGIVTAAVSAALRKVPSKSQWLADIPKGARVTVIGNSGNWLQIRTMVNGVQKTGYMSQELVSHSSTNGVANEMESMVGEKATWSPSGPSRLTGKANTFVKWAEAKTESVAPPVTSVTVINCWEMVLLAAYRSGAITWDFIHKLYLNTNGNWGDELPKRMTSGTRTSYDVTKKTPKPKRGELVFFDGAGHVALATGSGDQILTFWPPPNTKFTYGGTVDAVKKSTISALYIYMKNDPQLGTPKVTIGKPIW